MEQEKETLKQRAYRIIKERILFCQYLPGSDLNEDMLLKDTGLSRAPIRDALSRLEQEGLLKIIPKKGVRVSEVTLNDINTVYEMRSLIEPYNIRRHGDKIDKESLERFRRLFDDMAAPEKIQEAERENRLGRLYALDDEFHQYLISCSKNPYMERTMKLIYNQDIRLRILTSIDRSRLQMSRPEHMEIIDCLLQEQYEEAACVMERHLEKAKQASFQEIIKNGGWAK